jgi:hypothetical protein
LKVVKIQLLDLCDLLLLYLKPYTIQGSFTQVVMLFYLRTLFQQGVHKARSDPAFVLLNVGTATGLAGFTMSDPLPLRCCSITSSVASIIFTVTRTPVASYVPVYWSACFIGVNVYKIVQLLNERREIALSDMEEDLYVTHFMRSGMRPRQFKKLFDKSRRVSFKDGTVLHKEGDPFPDTVRLLYRGLVRIMTHDEEIFTVDSSKPICFLGDTHLLEMADKATGSDKLVPGFSATAIAVAAPGEGEVVAVEWDTVRPQYRTERTITPHILLTTTMPCRSIC